MPSMTMAEDESIYNLIPRPQEIPRRPPMHTSKYPGKVDTRNFEFGDNKAKGHATFGLPNGTNAASPQQFTIKHSKEPVLPAPAPPTQPKQKLRAPVPAKDDRPVMGLTSNKNFITANAVDVILKQPPRQPEEFVWTSKACYGKVPVYLRRNKARVTAEKEQFEQYLKMREAPDAQTSVTQLAQDDRQQLIRHLKKKWGVLNEAYQKLSLSVDSAVKKAKKEELERQLAEVEKDIKTLERGDIVLVVDE